MTPSRASAAKDASDLETLRQIQRRCVISADGASSLRTTGRRPQRRSVVCGSWGVVCGGSPFSAAAARLPGSRRVSRDDGPSSAAAERRLRKLERRLRRRPILRSGSPSPGETPRLPRRRAVVASGGASSPEVEASSAAAAHPPQRRPASREVAASPATTGRRRQRRSVVSGSWGVVYGGGPSSAAAERRLRKSPRLPRRRAITGQFRADLAAAATIPGLGTFPGRGCEP